MKGLVLVVLTIVSVTLAQSCTFTSANGEQFNLSPLTYDPSEMSPPEYTYFSNNDAYYVNFCESVSSSLSSACDGSGSCQQTGNTNWYSLGEDQSYEAVPFVPNGNFTTGIGLRYSNGGLCNTGISRTSTIYVACDESAGKGYLYDVEEVASCTYIMYFASSYGCPVSQLQSPCSYSDATGIWDLTPLSYDPNLAAPPGYSFSNCQNQEYLINFCQDVSTVSAPECPEGSGACQAYSGGVVSTGLSSSQEFVPFTPDASYSTGIAIRYTNGTFCGNGMNRVTTINIGCEPGYYPGYIYAVSEPAACEYDIRYLSAYGCPN